MHKIILITIFSFLIICSKAQYSGYTTIADAASFKSRFSTESQKIESIKSDFIQEKNLSLLNEKLISRGTFMYKKGNKLRMEFTHPFQYLMIINKDKVHIKDKNKETNLSSKSNKSFQLINKLMMDCISGNALNNTFFKSNIFENKNYLLIEAFPIENLIKQVFKKILIYIDKKDYSISMLEMHEVSGDNTLLKFTNKEINTKIADALFNIN